MQSPEHQIYTDSVALSLSSLDHKESDRAIETHSNLTMYESSMIIQVLLPYRRLWNCTILAYGCKEHPIIEAIQISNDIQMCMSVAF